MIVKHWPDEPAPPARRDMVSAFTRPLRLSELAETLFEHGIEPPTWSDDYVKPETEMRDEG